MHRPSARCAFPLVLLALGLFPSGCAETRPQRKIESPVGLTQPPAPARASASNASARPATIGASVRLEGNVAYVESAFPCDSCNPAPLELGQAVAVRALRLIDLEAEPVTFRGIGEAAGDLEISQAARSPALLCTLERSAGASRESLLIIVSLRDRQVRVVFAQDMTGASQVAFVRGEGTVLNLMLVQQPSIPAGYRGPAPHARLLVFAHDGTTYVNVGNDRGAPSAGPAIAL